MAQKRGLFVGESIKPEIVAILQEPDHGALEAMDYAMNNAMAPRPEAPVQVTPSGLPPHLHKKAFPGRRRG